MVTVGRINIHGVLTAVTWITAVVCANLTAEWFVTVGMVQFAIGTLFFGVTFTMRDVLHKYGRKAVYSTIAAGAITNLLVSFYIGIPMRIIGASFLAIVIAESMDTEVFQALQRKRWYVRALSSNAVSIPSDTLLFTAVAFAGVLPMVDFWQVVVGDTVVKFIIGAYLVWLYHRS